MTERERWIVYPLLFLALGASLRDKLAKQTRSQQIVCEELFVVNDRGQPVVRLSEGVLMLDGVGNTPSSLKVDYIQTNNLQTNNLQAQNIIQRGKPVGEVVSWGRLLQLFQQLGLIRVSPTQPIPIVPTPLSSEALPSEAIPSVVAPSESTPTEGDSSELGTESASEADEVSVASQELAGQMSNEISAANAADSISQNPIPVAEPQPPTEP